MNYQIYHYPNRENESIEVKKERIEQMNEYYKKHFSNNIPELLKLKHSYKIHIFAKTITGKTTMFDVYPNETILGIKNMISRKENISACFLKLMHGKILLNEEYKTLIELGIQKGHTIHYYYTINGC